MDKPPISDETRQMANIVGFIGVTTMLWISLMFNAAIGLSLTAFYVFGVITVFNAIRKHGLRRKNRVLEHYEASSAGIREFIEALKDDDGRLDEQHFKVLASFTDETPDREAKTRAENKYYARMVQHNNKVLCKA